MTAAKVEFFGCGRVSGFLFAEYQCFSGYSHSICSCTAGQLRLRNKNTPAWHIYRNPPDAKKEAESQIGEEEANRRLWRLHHSANRASRDPYFQPIPGCGISNRRILDI